MSTTYRTQQIIIREGHRLFPYLRNLCSHAKELANTTNFFIRQVFSAMNTCGPLHSLQHEVLQIIQNHLDAMNEGQRQAFEKRRQREQQKANPKTVTCTLFEFPTPKKSLLSYRFIDALFKTLKHPPYRSLPTQASQAIMRGVCTDWKSFFAALSAYKKNSTGFTGRPQLPNYIRAKYKTVPLTNQDCVIQGKYLKFPLTKHRLNIGKLGCTDLPLKSVRVVPKHGTFVVELVMEVDTVLSSVWNSRKMGIDLGIDNLAAMVTNTGMSPVLIKGKRMKAINQWYNKQKAHFYSVLRQGKKSNQGPFTSKRLEHLHAWRHRVLRDLFHKASYRIVEMAKKEGISTIVMGHNPQWKQEVSLGKRNNQSFCHIPHALLIRMITYKAEAHGIRVILQEESYTSQASFLDLDPLPVFDPEKRGSYTFSGKRVHRGLYQSHSGQKINADVNGASNILRKAFPMKDHHVVPAAYAKGISGLDGTLSVNVSTPLVLSVS